MRRMLCVIAAALLLCGSIACQTERASDAFANQTALPAPTTENVIKESNGAPTETPADAPTETPTVTTEPTDAPTETPTVTTEPTPKPVTRADLDSGAFDTFFDGAVFVGDSMTKEFGNYVRKQRELNGECLSTAQFMGEVSMTVRYASSKELVFHYRGGRVSLTTGLQKYEAKKVFLMLGANDIGHRDWDKVRADYCTMIERIQTDCPGVEIIVQGINPGTKAFCSNRNLEIAHWNSFNEILMEIAEKYDLGYYSFAEELMDEEGYLCPEYANGDLHLSAAGNEIWLRAARAYAARQLDPDAVLDLTSEPQP